MTGPGHPTPAGSAPEAGTGHPYSCGHQSGAARPGAPGRAVGQASQASQAPHPWPGARLGGHHRHRPWLGARLGWGTRGHPCTCERRPGSAQGLAPQAVRRGGHPPSTRPRPAARLRRHPWHPCACGRAVIGRRAGRGALGRVAGRPPQVRDPGRQRASRGHPGPMYLRTAVRRRAGAHLDPFACGRSLRGHTRFGRSPGILGAIRGRVGRTPCTERLA
jgi:hypothetical protein